MPPKTDKQGRPETSFILAAVFLIHQFRKREEMRRYGPLCQAHNVREVVG